MNRESKRILIVDDVSRNIQILGNILSQKNYKIAYAQSGIEAIEVCKTQKFDLILLDIMMTGMNGYEVCTALKKSKLTADIPIIFLTAKADMDSVIKGFELGGQDYITKPFNAAELLARVNTHLVIKEQKEQLQILNSNLENIVRERTMELERANDKLNKLDFAKNNFLSIISHELRTPLNGLFGLADMLDAHSDPDQKENIAFLKSVSSRLLNFSETALLITSLSAKQHLPEVMPVSLNNLILDSIEMFKEKNIDSELKFINNMPYDNLLVKADSELLVKCFVLVIENSAKFTNGNAKLTISARAEYNNIVIEFVDNGPGFSEDALNYLFELFSPGDTLHLEGAGLGLATIKLIIDNHDGSIEIQNVEDSGAKVIIMLPKQ